MDAQGTRVMSDRNQRSRALLLRATVIVMQLMSIALFAGGLWLVMLGGSIYYLVAGVVLAATSWLLMRRSAAALWVYAAMLLGTMAWAIWEVGFDFWSLAPRGDILVPLGVWLLFPFIVSHLSPGWRNARRALVLALLASAVVLVISLSADRFAIAGKLPQANAITDLTESPAKVDWTAYGSTGAGTRYSDLAAINKSNAKDLKLAWEFETGDRKGPDDPDEFTNEATPLKVDDLLYTCSPHQIVFALEAATGRLRWKFDPQIQRNEGFQHMTCRGVSYHETAPGAVTADGTPAPSDCPRRIFLPTDDGRLFALDADAGKPCEGFGDHGQIDLKEGNEIKTLGFYQGTSPPVVTDKILIMAGAVIDNYSDKVPSGAIPASTFIPADLSGRSIPAIPTRTRCRPKPINSPRARRTHGASPPSTKSSAWSTSRSDRARRTSGQVIARRTRSVTIPHWSRWTSPQASCAGRSRTCITTSGTWICRPSPACLTCIVVTTWCRRSISLQRPATSSCLIAVTGICSCPHRNDRCRKARHPAIIRLRRSRFPT